MGYPSKKRIANYELSRLIGEIDAIEVTDSGELVMSLLGQSVLLIEDLDQDFQITRDKIRNKLQTLD